MKNQTEKLKLQKQITKMKMINSKKLRLIQQRKRKKGGIKNTEIIAYEKRQTENVQNSLTDFWQKSSGLIVTVLVQLYVL